MSSVEDVWIGLAHVVPTSAESFMTGYAGAYVNVLVLCRNRAEFIQRLRAALEGDLRVVVSDIKDIEPLSIRKDRGDVHASIEQIAAELTIEHPVNFDDFQFYLDPSE